MLLHNDVDNGAGDDRVQRDDNHRHTRERKENEDREEGSVCIYGCHLKAKCSKCKEVIFFSLSLSLWYLCIKLNGRRHQHIIMFSLICFDLFIVFDNRDNIEGTSVSKICLIFVYVLFDICVWIRFSRHHLTRVYKCAFVYD